jgi:hypothetical protein
MRSHENSPYAWVDICFGPNKDAVHVIDKSTLELLKTLQPFPGKRLSMVKPSGKFNVWNKTQYEQGAMYLIPLQAL